MSEKNIKNKDEVRFCKEQILTSKKYFAKRDICQTVIPDNFYGTLKDADTLIEKFMKGRVN